MVDVPKLNKQCFGHLYLSGTWLGMDLRTSTKKTCVKNRLTYLLKIR